MRVLVTGGAGFIGSNFVRYWIKKHPNDKVVNLDLLTYAGNLENLKDVEHHENYTFVLGNICDRPLVDSLFDKENIDTVIHFAAESHVDRSITGPEAFIKTNVYGTFTLLDVARAKWVNRNECRFLHVSTDEVFGSLGNEGRFSEESPYQPRSPYAASKAAVDHLTRSMAVESARFGIRINAIAPGYYKTAINDAYLDSEAGQRMRKRIAMQRFGEYQELDGALVLLASDAASYITGTTIVVDGGHLLMPL